MTGATEPTTLKAEHEVPPEQVAEEVATEAVVEAPVAYRS